MKRGNWLKLGKAKETNSIILSKGEVDNKVVGIVKNGPKRCGTILGSTHQQDVVTIRDYRVLNLRLVGPNQHYHILFAYFVVDCTGGTVMREKTSDSTVVS